VRENAGKNAGGRRDYLSYTSIKAAKEAVGNIEFVAYKITNSKVIAKMALGLAELGCLNAQYTDKQIQELYKL
jgi:hypothetical protein